MKALWLSRRYALKAHCSISQHLALLSSPSSHEAKCDTNASLSLMVVCEASEVSLSIVSVSNRRRLWHSAFTLILLLLELLYTHQSFSFTTWFFPRRISGLPRAILQHDTDLVKKKKLLKWQLSNFFPQELDCWLFLNALVSFIYVSHFPEWPLRELTVTRPNTSTGKLNKDQHPAASCLVELWAWITCGCISLPLFFSFSLRALNICSKV